MTTNSMEWKEYTPNSQGYTGREKEEALSFVWKYFFESYLADCNILVKLIYYLNLKKIKYL